MCCCLPFQILSREGGAKRADGVAEELGADLAIISKKREQAGVVSDMTLVGQVEGKVCVIFDDMCDSGGTLVAAANLLKEHGADRVYAAVSHGIFSEPAVQRINDSVRTCFRCSIHRFRRLYANCAIAIV